MSDDGIILKTFVIPDGEFGDIYAREGTIRVLKAIFQREKDASIEIQKLQAENEKLKEQQSRLYKLIGLAEPIIKSYRHLVDSFVKKGFCKETDGKAIITKCEFFMQELKDEK